MKGVCMKKIEDWALDHVEDITYAALMIYIIGFGYICYSIGRMDA